MSFPWSGPALRGPSNSGLTVAGLSASLPFRHSLPVQSLSAAAMGALLLASASKHFRDPVFYRYVGPQYLCRQDPVRNTDKAAGSQTTEPQATGTETTEPKVPAGIRWPSSPGTNGSR